MGLLRLLLPMVLAAGSLAACATSSPLDDLASTNPLGADATPGLTPAINQQTPSTKQGEFREIETAHVRPATEGLVKTNYTPGSAAYKIGQQDVIEVAVFKVDELSKTVQVSDQGTINLPLVGEVRAAGRTTREIEQDLKAKWGAKYLQNPQVSVFVKEFKSQRITIQGAVRKPGVFPLEGGTTLLQAIALAGGKDQNSDASVVVLRQENGKRTVANFDLAQISSGAAQDPELRSGDVVVAGKSAVKELFNNILKAIPITSTFALL